MILKMMTYDGEDDENDRNDNAVYLNRFQKLVECTCM